MQSALTVPVSMGSPDATAVAVTDWQVTHVLFQPGARLDFHVHELPTFAVVLRGGFALNVRSGSSTPRYDCPAGTILAQPAFGAHANEISDRGARGIVLQPRDPHRVASAWLFERVRCFRDAHIEARARQIALELADPDDLSTLEIESHAIDMLSIMERSGDTERATPSWLRPVIELIHDRFRERVPVPELAAVAGVHPAHLAKAFRQQHREPIGTYVRRLRVDWAADQLRLTRKPISVIAAESGFADQAHLTRSFRRLAGITPYTFRRARTR